MEHDPEDGPRLVPRPSPEALAGQHLRLLRQGRGWSQQDVADKMGAYGYNWHQTTVAKLERGARPLRVNEAVDLAALFGIPPGRLVEPVPAPGDGTIEGILTELAELTARRASLLMELERCAEASKDAAAQHARLARDFEDINTRIRFLEFWLPAPEKRG